MGLADRLRAMARSGLIALGRRLPERPLSLFRSVLSYLELGAFVHAVSNKQGFKRLNSREAVFREAIAHVRGRAPLYLEFGVFEGRMLRWWADNVRNPEARFVGFDSFEGLPENWRTMPAGHFKLSAIPQIDDARVTLVEGWFENTLRTFEPPPHDQLIVNVDCDLYSSATTVLRWLEPHIRPGTLIYFDEFSDRDHEMRAFVESLARNQRSVTALATGRGGVQWLFRYE